MHDKWRDKGFHKPGKLQ